MADIIGTPNKTVYGTNEADLITVVGRANAYGRGGDDTIYGSEYNNKVTAQVCGCRKTLDAGFVA